MTGADRGSGGGAVCLRDGVEIHLDSGETVVCDARRPDGDVAVVSHAHGDHLYREPPAAACWSATTRALAGVRREDAALPERLDHPRIELLEAGHVPGSRAALIEGEDRTYLYTGDVSTRDRLYLEGFDPPSADVLVLEATYGEPGFEFPPVAETRAAFEDWLARNAARPVVVFGYALGRAQEIEVMLEAAGRDRVLVSDAIADVDDALDPHLPVTLPGERYDRDDLDLGAGDALVLPSATANRDWTDRLVEATNAATAGMSGWAVDSSYRYANGYDETFVLSDHCDFPELVALVEAVDPASVYTQHGSAESLARHLTRECGYPATALVANQRSLSEF